ncbi:MAG TPA: alpha/beta fold hydrolase [Caldilineaceae bacterium]|nr:alpha/beta fold hydrolase [Caldilineaceae bacterium]
MFELFPFRRQRSAAPAATYDEALRRFHQLQMRERSPDDGCILNERCHSLLLDHGAQTDHALVLIHGFTNCPYQFQQLAPLIHQQGHSVLAIRLPRHGCADRMTAALAELRIGELLDAVMEAVDIAHGLGRAVTVLGFSMGGVLAAWLAQNRADLQRVILVSPAVGLQALPPQRHRIIGYGLALLPNFFQWWHPKLKTERIGPDHAYPRFASRSLAVLIRLGLAVRTQAAQQRPATNAITVITNPSDTVIRHPSVERLVQNWSAHGATVVAHTFPVEWNLLHDIIDPLQEEQQVERVYPKLLQWIGESLQPVPAPAV